MSTAIPPPPPVTESQRPLSKRDFESGQEVRWCPGCGDYAILNAVQQVFPTLGIPREKFAIVSGIGCSSRFPYYMNTYGFHSIHGRAPAFATGLKVARPDLSVWVITGDGDALSIGGNHLIHAMRRNIDIKVLLFNNRIYGLTKGQYSPTSEVGKVTASTPAGSLDRPIDPISIALAAEATFVARSVDTYGAHLKEIITRVAAHRGSAFVEIYQNCLIFNDGAFDQTTEKAVRESRQVQLKHGQPLTFGANGSQGVRLENGVPQVVTVGEGGVRREDLWVHDERAHSSHAFTLARMREPEPIGVFRAIDVPTFNDGAHEQIAEARRKSGGSSLAKLLAGGDTWQVFPDSAGA